MAPLATGPETPDSGPFDPFRVVTFKSLMSRLGILGLDGCVDITDGALGMTARGTSPGGNAVTAAERVYGGALRFTIVPPASWPCR